MILIILLLVLLIGGLLAWVLSAASKILAKWTALLALIADLVITIVFWIDHGNAVQFNGSESWLANIQYEWIPRFGMTFHLAMDGISLVMTALTFFLGILAVLVSWKSIDKHTGFFYFNLLWLLAGITGVFLAMDMMLFYFFWEIMLVPMYFVMVIWGHENSKYAGWKFFLFTQLSGLLMLISILALYIIHGRDTGVYSFDYFQLLGTSLGAKTAFWLMGGFLIAFFVKLPVIPFHSWLPDAYVESPSAGTIIIAALMSKTAAYGLLRFVIPFFPDAARSFSTIAIIIGAASILYGAKLAYAQRNLKRLIAFSSVSHMGFILVGVFSFNELAYQGVLMQMVAHALSIAALFIISEFIYERIHTFDLQEMGGFWARMPNAGGFTLVFIMASLGLPGLANFVAEFLILAGAWQWNIILSVIATMGLIVSVIYSLRILQKVFQQRKHTMEWNLPDFSVREWIVMGSLTVAIVWLGFFPQSIIRAAKPAFDQMEIIHRDKNSSNQTSLFLKEKNMYPKGKIFVVLQDKKGGGLC